MEQLKKRKVGEQSRKKLITAINLYEQYVDEKIDTIKIWSSVKYLINDKWLVDISTNKVNRTYPDYVA
jgi:hypothetical protein